MSVNTPDVQDLTDVTEVVPPAKKSPTSVAKKVAPPPRPKAKSEEEIRSEVELELAKEVELRARIEAEVRARLEAEYAAKAPVRADASVGGVEETPYIHVTPKEGEEVIHFVDDGLTFGNKVYMRGEELALDPEDHPWIKYSRTQQIRKYGKALFAQGFWPYGGYDLTDENLSEQDKKKLLDLTSDEDFG